MPYNRQTGEYYDAPQGQGGGYNNQGGGYNNRGGGYKRNYQPKDPEAERQKQECIIRQNTLKHATLAVIAKADQYEGVEQMAQAVMALAQQYGQFIMAGLDRIDPMAAKGGYGGQQGGPQQQQGGYQNGPPQQQGGYQNP